MGMIRFSTFTLFVSRISIAIKKLMLLQNVQFKYFFSLLETPTKNGLKYLHFLLSPSLNSWSHERRGVLRFLGTSYQKVDHAFCKYQTFPSNFIFYTLRGEKCNSRSISCSLAFFMRCEIDLNLVTKVLYDRINWDSQNYKLQIETPWFQRKHRCKMSWVKFSVAKWGQNRWGH